jgi:hypothetical protein
MSSEYPSVRWCRTALRNSRVGPNRRTWQIGRGYVIDTAGLGWETPESHLVIALEIARRDGTRPKLSANQVSAYFHASFTSETQWPQWQGRPVDLEFFYAADLLLVESKWLELAQK